MYHETAPGLEPFWLHFFSQCILNISRKLQCSATIRNFIENSGIPNIMVMLNANHLLYHVYCIYVSIL